MTAADARRSVRLWLRLLTCSTAVERRVGQRLRRSFDSTLPRFDLMAALDRAGEAGLSMGEAASRLMVSNGNVTGLARRLEIDGLIERLPEADRRVQRVRLTPRGRVRFAAMAQAHAGWIDELFAGLGDEDVDKLTGLLERARASIQSALHEETANEGA